MARFICFLVVASVLSGGFAGAAVGAGGHVAFFSVAPAGESAEAGADLAYYARRLVSSFDERGISSSFHSSAPFEIDSGGGAATTFTHDKLNADRGTILLRPDGAYRIFRGAHTDADLMPEIEAYFAQDAVCFEDTVAERRCVVPPKDSVWVAMEIHIDGVKQIFGPDDYPTGRSMGESLDESGLVVLSAEPCVGVSEGCLNFEILSHEFPGPYRAGTIFDFRSLHVSGRPAGNTDACCGRRSPSAGSKFKGPSFDITPERLGNNRLSLSDDIPGGVPISCMLGSQVMFH